jgi:hypothetical protein
MNKYNDLINDLSRDLAPVTPGIRVKTLATAWFSCSALFVVAATFLFGPVRPGVLAQLVSEPRFLLESLLGLMAILWVSLMAFRSAIPANLPRWFSILGLALIVLWLAQYVIGFASPALEPSSFGKRGHCFSETLVYSVPPIFVGLYLIRRLYPVRPVRTAMSLSLAAGMLPALYMQLACMYEPSHILSFHILPGLLMVFAGTAIAAIWGQPRRATFQN